jgi:sulfoxide reductase heme-binding subunit YedZ
MKPAVFAVCLVPLGRLSWDALAGRLGANPIAEVMNRLGFWTLTLLSLSLLPTPLKEILGISWPMRLRRLLGLFAFSYAVLHFATYLVLDQFFDLTEIWKDIAQRKFITVGMAALLLLVPLAVTSTDGWVRRLGYARWKRIHRLAYLAAILGVVHFLWRVKADLRAPSIFAVVIGSLLLVRAIPWLRRKLARLPSKGWSH